MKKSRHIPLYAAQNFCAAVGYANQTDKRLNRHLTISWEMAQTVGRIQDVQVAFLARMSKWLQYRHVTPVYAWVLELGGYRGLHGHYLIHVPSEHLRAFKRMVPRWIARNGDVDRDTWKLTHVRYGAGTNELNAVKGITRYMLKGLEADAAELLGIQPVPQGVIHGKRIGTSQSIGAAARWKQAPPTGIGGGTPVHA